MAAAFDFVPRDLKTFLGLCADDRYVADIKIVCNGIFDTPEKAGPGFVTFPSLTIGSATNRRLSLKGDWQHRFACVARMLVVLIEHSYETV